MTENLSFQNPENCHIRIPADMEGVRFLTIAARDPLSVKFLKELAVSLEISCCPDIPDNCGVHLQCTADVKRLTRDRRGTQLTILYPPEFVHDHREALLLRECVFAAAAQESFAVSGGMTLFHGTFLEENKEEGILLFGESGIGKSTTWQRWLAEGGTSCADDALLLIENNEQYYVRPLPTWSHWLVNGNVRRYPVNHPFRVRALYWLSRGAEKQCIVPAEPARYHCQLLSAMLLHSYGLRRTFSAEEIRKFGERAWGFIQKMDHTFPASTFRAHLDFPLKKTFYPGGK